MKNKKLTYFLVFVVTLVWGLILYRIFAVAGAENDLPDVPVKVAKEAYNDYDLPKDTTKLLLNYRDPFGLVPFKDTTKTTPATHHSGLAAAKPVPAINWSFIQYAGYIRNPASRKLVALVMINGKNEMLSEGDTKDQVKLLKNLRDSIKISFSGKTKFITLKSVPL